MHAYQDNFFARGPSPLARLTFFALIAIGVMVADHRFQALPFVRLGVSAVITPIEQTLLFPGTVARRAGEYLSNQSRLIDENARLKAEVLELAAASQQSKLVRAEQTYLGALAGADKRFGDRGIVAEIIRDARNPFARKVIIDKGLSQGLTAGLAVIDGKGVVGQVTAVGILSSEVTLTTEKDQAVPVMVVRNGLRAIAVGTGREGTIDVPFIPVGADVQVGDALVTSGIDGTYPAGLSVGLVTIVDKNPAFPFARISANPAAGTDQYRFVRVLTQQELHDYPRPDVKADEKRPAREAGSAARRRDSRGGR
ncbi:MAG: rod shape-determining protein MreC [Betaproteobacteria bacterium]